MSPEEYLELLNATMPEQKSKAIYSLQQALQKLVDQRDQIVALVEKSWDESVYLLGSDGCGPIFKHSKTKSKLNKILGVKNG